MHLSAPGSLCERSRGKCRKVVLRFGKRCFGQTEVSRCNSKYVFSFGGKSESSLNMGFSQLWIVRRYFLECHSWSEPGENVKHGNSRVDNARLPEAFVSPDFYVLLVKHWSNLPKIDESSNRISPNGRAFMKCRIRIPSAWPTALTTEGKTIGLGRTCLNMSAQDNVE